MTFQLSSCKQCNKPIRKTRESWAGYSKKKFCTFTCLRLWQWNHVAVFGPGWRKYE